MARYFAPKEFQRCSPACDIVDMYAPFLDILDNVRERAGIPLVLNSAYRPRSWELQNGRSGNSAHCKGKAVDIRATTSQSKIAIVRAALECGITRIGVGSTFVHIDIDESLPQNVMWTY